MLLDSDNSEQYKLISCLSACPNIVPTSFQLNNADYISPELVWKEVMRDGSKHSSQISRDSLEPVFEAWLADLFAKFPASSEAYVSLSATRSLPWLGIKNTGASFKPSDLILPLLSPVGNNPNDCYSNIAIMTIGGSDILVFRDDLHRYVTCFCFETSELNRKISEQSELGSLLSSIPGVQLSSLDENIVRFFSLQNVQSIMSNHGWQRTLQTNSEGSQTIIDNWILQCFNEFRSKEKARDAAKRLDDLLNYRVEADYLLVLSQYPNLPWAGVTVYLSENPLGGWLLPICRDKNFESILLLQNSFGVTANNSVFYIRKDKNFFYNSIDELGQVS